MPCDRNVYVLHRVHFKLNFICDQLRFTFFIVNDIGRCFNSCTALSQVTEWSYATVKTVCMQLIKFSENGLKLNVSKGNIIIKFGCAIGFHLFIHLQYC